MIIPTFLSSYFCIMFYLIYNSWNYYTIQVIINNVYFLGRAGLPGLDGLPGIDGLPGPKGHAGEMGIPGYLPC